MAKAKTKEKESKEKAPSKAELMQTNVQTLDPLQISKAVEDAWHQITVEVPATQGDREVSRELLVKNGEALERPIQLMSSYLRIMRKAEPGSEWIGKFEAELKEFESAHRTYKKHSKK